MKSDVLNSWRLKYQEQAQRAETNIKIALANVNSIPDHFNFVEDLEEQLLALDKAKSVLDTIDGLE